MSETFYAGSATGQGPGRRKKIWIGAAVAVLLLAVVWGLRRGSGQSGPLGDGSAPVTTASGLYDPGDKPTTIFMKLVSMETGQTVTSSAVIRLSKSRLNQMKQAVLAYLQGPREGALQVCVPEGAAMNELYLTANGTAVLDVSLAGADNSHFGLMEEVLFVRAIVHLLSSNFTEVKRARILIDGRESSTLAGHYALGTGDNTFSRPSAAAGDNE